MLTIQPFSCSCTKERKQLDKCFEEKMGMTRPKFGYFSQMRVHETSRPRPKSFATEFKNKNEGVTEEFYGKMKEIWKLFT